MSQSCGSGVVPTFPLCGLKATRQRAGTDDLDLGLDVLSHDGHPELGSPESQFTQADLLVPELEAAVRVRLGVPAPWGDLDVEERRLVEQHGPGAELQLGA